MRVVFDTSVFIPDFRLRGTAFRVFFGSFERLPIDVYIPRVVFEELVNKFSEAITEAVKESEKALSNACDLLGRKTERVLNKDEIPKEVAKYRKFLNTFIERNGIKFLPYPTISHEKVLKRALSRKKPFKEKGGGYRDFLIWQSVLALLRTGKQMVVFLTGNVKDFGKGEDIHPDLVEELEKRDIDKGRLYICTGVRNFNEEFVLPKLKPLEKIKGEISESVFNKFDLHSWVLKDLLRLIWDDPSLGVLCLGFDEGVGPVWLDSVDRLKEVETSDVLLLDTGEVLLKGSATFDVILNVEVSWDEYLKSKAVRDFLGTEEGPFGYSLGEHRTWLRVAFSILFKNQSFKIAEDDINELEGEFGWWNSSGYSYK